MKIGTVRLGNKYSYSVHKPEPGEVVINIDRPNALSNPYFGEDRREISISKFKQDFDEEIARAKGSVVEAVKEIVNNLLAGQNVILMCWCHPRACHGDVIKAEAEKLVGNVQSMLTTLNAMPGPPVTTFKLL